MSRTRDARLWLAVLGLSLGLLLQVTSSAGSEQPARADQVTFAKDIAPILQRSCQSCHRPDSLAPMSLITYEEVRPWARAIKQRTHIRNRQGVMPPWYMERDVGIQRYKNDVSLSEEQLAKIAKWADSGAPRGISPMRRPR